MLAAHAVGATKVLVRTGWGEPSLGKHRHKWEHVQPDKVATDLLDATETWDYGVAWMELKSALNHYLGNSADSNPIRSLRDVIEFNNQHAETALKYGQDVFENSDKWTGSLREPEYLNSLTENLEKSRSKGIDHALKSTS